MNQMFPNVTRALVKLKLDQSLNSEVDQALRVLEGKSPDTEAKYMKLVSQSRKLLRDVTRRLAHFHDHTWQWKLDTQTRVGMGQYYGLLREMRRRLNWMRRQNMHAWNAQDHQFEEMVADLAVQAKANGIGQSYSSEEVGQALKFVDVVAKRWDASPYDWQEMMKLDPDADPKDTALVILSSELMDRTSSSCAISRALLKLDRQMRWISGGGLGLCAGLLIATWLLRNDWLGVVTSWIAVCLSILVLAMSRAMGRVIETVCEELPEK